MRRLTAKLLLGVGAGWPIFAAEPAWGGPSHIAVRMRCPVLSEVSAAEFEARAKVDLSVRSTVGGELEVVCDHLAARIRWRERAGAWFARAVPPTATPSALVDALLVASKDLVEEAAHFDKGATGGAKEQEETPDPSASGVTDASDAAESEPAPGRADERPRTEERPHHVAATPDATAPSSDRTRLQSTLSGELALGVSAGAQAALFTLRGTGMVGPSVGVFVALPAGFVASLAGEYDFAFGAGDVVTVRVAGAAAVIAAQFGPARAFEVGLGGLVGGVFVSSEVPYQPTSDALGFWGAIVRARYALGKDAWRFAGGPDIRFHGVRPEVAVDRAVVWGVPTVSVGLVLEVRRELYGAR
jgi:hypothetical protein